MQDVSLFRLCDWYYSCSISIVNICYKERKNIKLDSPMNEMSKEQKKRILVSLVSAFAYILCIRYIGYFSTTFIFVSAFSYWQSKENKKYQYLAVSAVMAVVIFFAFKVFLRVPLPAAYCFDMFQFIKRGEQYVIEYNYGVYDGSFSG